MKEIKECPLCGKNIRNDEALCNDCKLYAEDKSYVASQSDTQFSDIGVLDRYIIPEELDEEQAQELPKCEIEEDLKEEQGSSNSVESINQDEKVKGDKPKMLIFFLFGCLLVVVLGIWGVYNVIDVKKLGETEDMYWQLCAVENNPTSYAKYLVRFPDGKFEELAHQKLRELRDQEIAEWNELQQSSDINDYNLFITNNPHTPYMVIIQTKIDSLMWDKTVQEGTAEGYKAYLDNIKLNNVDGVYREQAEYRYNYLSQIRSLEKRDLDSISSQLNLFYEALTKMDKDKLEESLGSTFYYYGNQLTYTSLVNILKNSYKENNITNIIYRPHDSQIEAFIDNKGFVFVNLVVEREMTTSVPPAKDGKKGKAEIEKSIQKDTLQLEINAIGEIVSIDRRQDAPLFGLKKRDTK